MTTAPLHTQPTFRLANPDVEPTDAWVRAIAVLLLEDVDRERADLRETDAQEAAAPPCPTTVHPAGDSYRLAAADDVANGDTIQFYPEHEIHKKCSTAERRQRAAEQWKGR